MLVAVVGRLLWAHPDRRRLLQQRTEELGYDLLVFLPQLQHGPNELVLRVALQQDATHDPKKLKQLTEMLILSQRQKINLLSMTPLHLEVEDDLLPDRLQTGQVQAEVVLRLSLVLIHVLSSESQRYLKQLPKVSVIRLAKDDGKYDPIRELVKRVVELRNAIDSRKPPH
jgi:hypothetical protein